MSGGIGEMFVIDWSVVRDLGLMVIIVFIIIELAK